MAAIDTIDRATHVIADLEVKRTALVERAASHDDTRRQLATAVHVGGDKAARKKLDDLNVEAATYRSELRSIDDALAQARGDLDAARHAMAIAENRDRARALRKLNAKFLAASKEADGLATAYIAKLVAMRDLAVEMRRHGAGVPNGRQEAVLTGIAVQTHLMSLPTGREGLPFLPPSQRRSHTANAKSWFASNEREIAATLGEQTTSKEREAADARS